MSEVLLDVRNLKQYFKLGRSELKAVDDISFFINKGEVFGLVGESGCGKTTTGRAIIKLYEATGGEVYFKGRRIVAGQKDLKAEYKAARKAHDKARASELAKAIESAEYDQKYCDKTYAKELIKAFEKNATLAL
jgi:oligopeptide transport system ATP-binding protein